MPYLKSVVEKENKTKHPFGLSNAQYFSARTMKREKKKEKQKELENSEKRSWKVVKEEKK
jgi:hypothetical protein